ncbi:MAG: FAD-binding oxidoreductase [Wenzhouxiangella sp.]|nr:MAG: FAD-binding oxidoreductase [Wenzhouxiangella sp.]
MNSAALSKLRGLLGPGGVLTPSDDLSRYEQEWRGRYRSLALAVARPCTTGELSGLVEICAAHRIAMVPQGGNTGLVGGAVACGERRELIVSLERMRSIRSIDVDSASMTVEAGCTLEQAALAAHEAGLRLPLALASGGSATIGGVLATNAGGNETIRFGNARAMLLGLEAVFADGRVWSGLSSLRKDNSGYNLAQLLAGSEGTLAIITAATLALKPLARQREVIWLTVASPAAAVAVLRRARAALGETLTAFELMPALAIEFVLTHLGNARCPVDPGAGWHVLMDCESSVVGEWLREAVVKVLEEALSAGEVGDAAIAESRQQAEAFWLLRESISDAQAVGGLSLKHDISVPTAAMPAFIDSTLEELETVVSGLRPCVFGHVGDGNLHFNLTQPRSLSAEAFRALEPQINETVFARVLEAGGSIAAEHGIGLLRRDRLEELGDPVRLEKMRRIKRALDPGNLLNPGKIVRMEKGGSD